MSLAVSSPPLPLLDPSVDREGFQGTEELRFFVEFLAPSLHLLHLSHLCETNTRPDEERLALHAVMCQSS